MFSRILKLFVIACLTLATLSGCNTARGFGEDVQHLGSKISHAAN
ncbi:entericidin A/B family lipoprotein [Acerihabitans sp. KWT182]|uniref:Entericidin A/B family lipoprotein n=1 Tax=Acerihabitans sp. KWT182 TaxID=3157919 RepID=A0AAU7QHL4_9GAMM